MTTEIRTNPTSKASSRSSAALTSMGDALLQHYREITTLIAEADRQDVRIRYRIAVHCQEVRNGDGNGGRYGAKAVKKLTQALKWCKSLVYAYADVAVTWPDANKFDELVARSNRFDKPLTWSHFILLATVTDDARREKLIDDSLHNGWTVRELQVMMRTGPTEEYEEADAAETEPKLPPDLAAAIQNYGRWLRLPEPLPRLASMSGEKWKKLILPTLATAFWRKCGRHAAISMSYSKNLTRPSAISRNAAGPSPLSRTRTGLRRRVIPMNRFGTSQMKKR